MSRRKRRKRPEPTPAEQVAEAVREATARGYPVIEARWCEESRGVVITVGCMAIPTMEGLR